MSKRSPLGGSPCITPWPDVPHRFPTVSISVSGARIVAAKVERWERDGSDSSVSRIDLLDIRLPKESIG